MARSIEIDMASRGAQKDITVYFGEGLEIRPGTPLEGGRLVLAVSDSPRGTPLLQVAGGEAVIAPASRLAVLGEGVELHYDLWHERGAELELLCRGRFAQRDAIEPVAGPEPVNLALPRISGRFEVGARLTLEPGRWEGAERLDPGWRRDGAAIAGATETVLDLGPAEEGRWVDAQVVARGPSGATLIPARGGAVVWPAPVAAGVAPLQLVPGEAVDLDLSGAAVGEGLRYSIDPEGDPLPEGLALSAAGQLSGRAEAQTTRRCLIRAANSGGAVRVAVDISLARPAPRRHAAADRSPRLIVLGDETMTAGGGALDMAVARLGDKLARPEGFLQTREGATARDMLDALAPALALVEPGRTVALLGPLGRWRAAGSAGEAEIAGQIEAICDALLDAGATVAAVPTLPETGAPDLTDALAARLRDMARDRPDLHVVDIGARETEGRYAGRFNPAVSFDPETMLASDGRPDARHGAPFLAARVADLLRARVDGSVMPVAATASNLLGAVWSFAGSVPSGAEGVSGAAPEGWQVTRQQGNGDWVLDRDAEGRLTVTILDSPDAGRLEIALPVAGLGGAAGDLFDLLAAIDVAPGGTAHGGEAVGLDGIAPLPALPAAPVGAPGGRLYLRSPEAALTAARDATTARIALGIQPGGSAVWTLRGATLERRGAMAVPLAIAGTPEPAQPGAPYGFAPRVTGGHAPYAHALVAGALPAGLTLDAASGAVTGMPQMAGDAEALVIEVTDAAGATARLGPFAIRVAATTRAAPYRVAVYGDSFGQRATDILGAPNSLDSAKVNPVNFRWPTEDTDRVGGVSWGAAAWLSVVSGGRYRLPYWLNRAVGGSNSGQLTHEGGTSTDRLSVITSLIADEIAAGRAVDAVVFHVGTNDMVADFTAAQSYDNIKLACERMIAAGAGCVVLHTVLPRGSATFPNDRIDGTGTGTGGVDRRAVGEALNGMLKTDLPAEATLSGKVAVADLFSAFEDPAGRAWDVRDDKVYDGLHLSAGACRELAEAMKAELDALLPTEVRDNLAVGPDGHLGTLGNFEGTGGTTGAGFTGDVATGWGITSLTRFADAQVAGTKACSKEAGKQVVTISADATGVGDSRTATFQLFADVTLPADVAVGDYFEAGIELEIIDPVQLRSTDLELRVTDPDAIVRRVRACRETPNNTTSVGGIEQNDRHTLPARNETVQIWTPPRERKPGDYGTITFGVVIGFAGGQADIGGTFRFSRATLRRAAV